MSEISDNAEIDCTDDKNNNSNNKKHYDIEISFHGSHKYINIINWRVLIEMLENAPNLYDKISHIGFPYRRTCECVSYDCMCVNNPDRSENDRNKCYHDDDEDNFPIERITKLPAKLISFDYYFVEEDNENLTRKFESLNYKLPDTIEKLDLDFNKLNKYPFQNVPSNLTEITIDCCNFETVLPSFPAPLEIIYFRKCNNIIIPSLKHTNLIKFVSYSCNLNALPELPDTIRRVACEANKIENIDNLPSTLEELRCNRNSIRKIKKLPANLKILNCSGNHDLTEICELPLLLNDFRSRFCKLEKLPKLKHLTELIYFEVDNNKLTWIPELPMSIKHINISNNNLLEFPNIPLSVDTYDLIFNDVAKLNKPMILFIKYHFNKIPNRYNWIRRLNIIYPSSSINCNKMSINCDNNAGNLYSMLTGNPVIYSLLKYRNDIYKYFNDNFRDIGAMIKLISENPTKLYDYYNSVCKIEKWFLECKYNPKYKYCRRRLEKEYDEIFNE